MSEPLLQNLNNNPYQPTKYDIEADKDIRASFAADVNPLQQKKTSFHIKALIASTTLWIALPTLIVLIVVKAIEMEQSLIIPLAFALYIFYLILSICCNPLFSYLKNIQHGAKFEQQYKKVKSLEGHFVFHVQCYHYETRHHTRRVSDGKGGTKTQHYTTTEKVVTHTKTQFFYPIKTWDSSGNVDQVRALTSIIFVRYIVNYRFIDQNSRQVFDHEWFNFKSRNKYDVHQNYSYNYEVPGLVERMTFFIGQQKPKWFQFLILWTIVGLIWPFSMWVETKISRYNLSFLKILTIGYKN